MDQYIAELQRMQESLEGLRGEALLKRVQEIVELGKKHEDGDVVAEWAQALMELGSALGRLDYEMRGFGELQALYLSDARFADLRGQVLWHYKWLGERLPEYVEVPAEQVWGFLDRMETFYTSEKMGLKPVHGLRCRAASFMGQGEEAARHFELWESAEEDESDDCAACQTHLKVQVLLDQGKMDEAIEAAGPVLEGEQFCDEVPAVTVSRLLVPMMASKMEELPGLFGAVQRQVRVVPKLVGYLADQVVFLALVGGWRLARPRGYLMLARVEETLNTHDQFLVARAAWVLYAGLRNAGVREVKLPRRLEGAGEAMERRVGRARWTSRRVGIDEAVAEFEAKTMKLAEAFDARNGTERFTKRTMFAKELSERRDWGAGDESS